jgi:ribosomal-protein-alanine N-acetyltransferase
MRLPPYENFPTIIGDTISLRQILPADIQDLIEISVYDGVRATTLEQAAAMQARIDADYNDGNSIHWGIANNLTHKMVGTCGYYRGLDKGEGELGCILLPQFRGQGFMTAGMLLAIDFGFNHIGLKRIWAATGRQNAKAIKLLEQLNFKKIADLEDDHVEYELR